ncbi:EAL domain-containing protein [Ectothiorhodospira shaposhnikovii]|uniref:bifunctional diguanylate cyclase/phosphodiesterase n=1 Tax=Ectothiorhodospira shaposhnikovii TaxID=1054 RepID=UPI001EE9414B|nr:EAL domain-containing protein [Ectothiorhodospira shaposhnikovii]
MTQYPPLGDGRHRHIVIKAWMLYLGFCLVLALIIAWDLTTSRAQDTEAARQRTHSTSVLVSEWLYAAFETSGALLSSMAGEIRPENLPPPEGDPEAHARINQWLERHLRLLPHAQAIALFDREGVMTHASGSDLKIDHDISDQSHFLALRADPDLERLVSRAFWSRESERFLVVHAQSLRDAEGRFAGLLEVGLDLGFFDHWLERAEPTPGSSLTIVDHGERLLARRPRDALASLEAQIGQPVEVGRLMPLILGEKDTLHFVIVSPVDGMRRAYTAQMVRDLPFLVVAGEAQDVVMAAWWRKVWTLSLAWWVIVGLGLLVLRGYLHTLRSDLALQRSHRSLEAANRFLSREIQERQEAEADLRRSEEKYRFLVDNSYDIIYLFSPDGHIRFVSPSWKTLLGHDPDSVLGHHFSEFVHPEDLHLCLRAFADVMHHGHHIQDIEYRVLHSDGSWRWHSSSALPSRDEGGKIAGFQGIARDITARKQAEEEIRTLAFYDPLTQLPNRRLLTERLEASVDLCRREHHHGALLFIDLDNFKILNDTLGHDQGDRLLMQAAKRIIGCVHENDTVARLGGDEFVVMLHRLSHEAQEATQQAGFVADKILAALNHPYRLGDQEHHGTASVGITLFDRESLSVDELMKRADLAMYQAKAAGRNTHRLFDPAMQASVMARAALEGDLRRALVEKQFLLHYQAVVNDDSQLMGAEALLRWQHPERGLVPPGEFVALAEDTGLILPLGQWVLETACTQLAQWAGDASLRHLKMAVNVSARQFRHPDFVPGVLKILNTTGADPHRLKLEITESLLLEDVEDVIDKMRQLRARGITFSLDDFGTGYSSLSYLKRLPLDDVKIDQSFVRDVLNDPNDAAIARTIVALAGTLGLRVIAEGVETREHWEWLSRNGCHTHQGYYFGRPGPVGMIQEAIRNWTPPTRRAGNPGTG